MKVVVDDDVCVCICSRLVNVINVTAQKKVINKKINNNKEDICVCRVCDLVRINAPKNARELKIIYTKEMYCKSRQFI